MNGGSKMVTSCKVTRYVGVFYIIGTVAGILSLISAGSVIHAPDYCY